MSADARFEELVSRISLAEGTPTLIILVTESDVRVDEARSLVAGILRQREVEIADLGACDLETGPGRWVKLTRETKAAAYLLSASPLGPFSGSAFAVLLNTEREFLRDLSAPVLLLVARETERVIRQKAPDFFTWAARTYEIPAVAELSALARQKGTSLGPVSPIRPEEPPIRFLHLSDFHLRPQRVKRYDQDRVLRGLVEFLERDRARFPLDLIFVTGDLAQSGRSDEYALVADLFRRLLDVTGVKREHCFIVPGNHDVDRDVGRWLRRTLDTDEEAIAFFEDAEARRFHLQKFDAYRKNLTPIFGEGRALGLGVGDEAVEIVTVKGARIAVASFNSAFFAQGDDDNGKLWLGEPNVDRAGDRIADEGANVAIALMHHPFEELHELERDSVGRRCERLFDVVLRGHMHQQKSRSIASQRGGYVELAAPSAYQGSPWPNGCTLGELRPRSGTVRLVPYAYASGADPWVLDTKVFPDNAEQGYSHTFTVSEKRRTPSALRRHLAKATEEAVRAAPEAVQRQVARELGIDAPSSRMSKEVAKKAAKAASAWGDQAQMQGLIGPEAMGKHLGMVALEMWQKGGEALARLSRSDPDFPREVLSRLAEIAKNATAPQLMVWPDNKKVLVFGLVTVIEHIVEGPVSFLERFGDWASPAILIGEHGDPPEKKLILVIEALSGAAPIAGHHAELDQRMGAANAVQGAVVVVRKVDAFPPQWSLKRVSTRDGRDVLWLDMPILA